VKQPKAKTLPYPCNRFFLARIADADIDAPKEGCKDSAGAA
jgi:hypothetical protein